MRPSTAIRALGTAARTFVSVFVGAIFLMGGIMGAVYQIEHPPVVKAIFYATLGAAVFGALILPTIFPIVKQIVVFVVPYIPLIGGRRVGDPPAPPTGTGKGE